MGQQYLRSFTRRRAIAYFSMEIGLCSEIPTYSGGLGVLAGDTLRSAADLELPLVGVTLISRRGYFRQIIDPDGRQYEAPAPWNPERWCSPLGAKVCVRIAESEVWIQAWLYTIEGGTGYRVPILLLDTDLPENDPEDREITHFLYGGDETYRLRQEIVLGMGGVRILRALGFDVHIYHMNEGHSALLALELLSNAVYEGGGTLVQGPAYDVAQVRDACLFTTHTPVEAGHDQFSYELVTSLLGDLMDWSVVRKLAGETHLNMTRLALNLSGYVNGVAKTHAALSSSLFPGYRVHAVTNGIHPATWAAPAFQRLYDSYLPNWRHEPELLVRADQIPDEDLWRAHCEAKSELISLVGDRTGVELDPRLPIIGFARRFTTYKRPGLLFSDPERLRSVVRERPFQLVMAGKAHPRDEPAKELLRAVHRWCRDMGDEFRWAFLLDYDMALGLALASGADLWLNTPQRPMEASGTSGMKSALNAVPNLGILDGWWVEGCIEGVTGWAVGTPELPDVNSEDAQSLYDKLERLVLPLYHDDRTGWIRVMKGAVSKNAYYFNSLRMMRRYAAEAYIR